MNRNSRYGFSKKTGIDRPQRIHWKRVLLVGMVVILLIGLMGCSMDDLLTPFTGDIPFEPESTAPSEMGSVDDTPTVPEFDGPLGDVDFAPL